MKTNRSIPAATVVPVLVCTDVRGAADFLIEALGFVERLHIPPNHRIQLSRGDGAIIVAERGAPGPQNVLLRVDDVASVLARAVAAGASVVSEPQDYPYGERQATIDDPSGHRWTLSQTLFDSDPESWGGQVPSPA
jgi:uncharacterized glyoxalase superfamily protein PhnB